MIEMSSSTTSRGYEWTHDENRMAQIRRGLELSPAERLEWLEVTMEELRSLVGRAAGRGREADRRD